jgi:hypothetical protein
MCTSTHLFGGRGESFFEDPERLSSGQVGKDKPLMVRK